MALVQYSAGAERDVMSIADYTRNRWSEDQAIRYLDDLEACCEKLATFPELGRACDDVRPGLRRMEHGKHVIFYRQQTEGILVTRILHQSMLPGRQPMADDEA